MGEASGNQSRLIEADAHALKCAHPGCNLPTVVIRAGLLVVKNRHRGEAHENSINLQWLLREIEQITGESCTQRDVN